MAKENAVQARVMGKVQGVAYRAWTQGTARGLGLRGWVRNEDDGSVSAFLVGTSERLDQMVSRMWDGPGAASVRDVEVKSTAPKEGFNPFEIHR